MSPPAPYKTYFDNPSMSDITIKLSDRYVHLQCVILCRGSEYFDNLLDGKFQESDAKEVELQEDDPEAMMAVFRHLYGLPYDAGQTTCHDGAILLPHMLAYAAAEKYQVIGLKNEACAAIRAIFFVCMDEDVMASWLKSSDHCDAIREVMYGTTPNDDGARNILIEWCVLYMGDLHKNETFMKLVAETPELGADIVSHIYNRKLLIDLDADYDPDEDPDEEYCEICNAMTKLVCLGCVASGVEPWLESDEDRCRRKRRK